MLIKMKTSSNSNSGSTGTGIPNYNKTENDNKKFKSWHQKKDKLEDGMCRVHRHQNFDMEAPEDADFEILEST